MAECGSQGRTGLLYGRSRRRAIPLGPLGGGPRWLAGWAGLSIPPVQQPAHAGAEFGGSGKGEEALEDGTVA
jgi:hypothetical protein